MEKILLAIDALQPALNMADFGCYMARLTGSTLEGYFFENYAYERKPFIKLVHGMPYVEAAVPESLPENEAVKNEAEQNIRTFVSTCEEKGIQLTVHRSPLEPIQEMITESRFADMIIADAGSSFTMEDKDEKLPSPFIKELLAGAECPVVVAPASFHGIEEIVFCYNGSRSSVFAMKQLTYLLPELNETKVVVLEVNKEGDILPDERLRLGEWLQRHYRHTEIIVLKGDPAAELFAYLQEKQNLLVVMGAYSRSMLSRFFKQSHADALIRTFVYPVFITHH